MVTGRVDERLCGSFVEHLGRTVYGGIYDLVTPRATSMVSAETSLTWSGSWA